MRERKRKRHKRAREKCAIRKKMEHIYIQSRGLLELESQTRDIPAYIARKQPIVLTRLQT